MLAAAGLEIFEFRVFRAQTCVSMVCSEREGPDAPDRENWSPKDAHTVKNESWECLPYVFLVVAFSRI